MRIVAVPLTVLVIASLGYVSFRGLDLRKPTSWSYGGLGFLFGFAIGLLLSGNLIEGLKGGVLFGFSIVFAGATMRWHKQRYGGAASSLLLQYGRPDDPSFFAKLVRKVLGKYK